MKLYSILTVAAIVCCVSSCGTSSQITGGTAATAAPSLVVQTDPIVIELEYFESHNMNNTTERSYITLYDGMIQGRIASLQTMLERPGFPSGRYALSFDKCVAKIGEPRVNKKGTSYTFRVLAEDASFFDSIVDTDWSLTITISDDGRASVNIESESIARVYSSRSWRFNGSVNKDRTEVLKLMKANNPSGDWGE